MKKEFPKPIWIALVVGGLIAIAYFITPKVSYLHSDLIAEHVISSDTLTSERHFDTLSLDSIIWLASIINQSEVKCQMERINEGEANDSLKVFNTLGFNKKFFRRDFMNNRKPQEYNSIVNMPIHAFEQDIHSGFKAPIIKVGKLNYVILPFDIVASLIEQFGKETALG